MNIEFSSAAFHHAPPGVSCGLLLILAFPLIALAILRKWPFLPVLFFYTPLFISFAVALYIVLLTFRGAPLPPARWQFGMFAWGIAEAIAAVGYGAASSFVAALINLRVRRRAMYPVFPITLAVVAASWLGVRVVLDLG